MSNNILNDLENIIETNQHRFYEIGKSLKQIRNNKLYRELLYDSFGEYVKTRWDMAKSHAYRLIEASKVIDNLSPIGDTIVPSNEFQARVISRLPKRAQRRMWKGFITTGMDLTAANIKKYIKTQDKKIISKIKIKPANLTDIIGKSYNEAVIKMLEEIRIARNDDWEETTKDAALFWNRVMKERITTREY